MGFVGLEAVVGPEPVPFSGIKRNPGMNDLKSWEAAFCEPYGHISRMEDFQLPGVARDSAVLVGARKFGASELLLAAIGKLDVIVAKTTLNSTKLHNGVHWYCTPGQSMVFAPDANVEIFPADCSNWGDPYRVSWVWMEQEDGVQKHMLSWFGRKTLRKSLWYHATSAW